MYRLLLSDCGFTYQDVFFKMTPQEIQKANIALDIKMQEEKKAMKKKR